MSYYSIIIFLHAYIRAMTRIPLDRKKLILEKNPDIQRATYANTRSNPHNVILTIAICHFTTCEMLISKAKYDPFQLLALIETQGQETHYD